jgi:hypothetical protein
MRMIVILCSVRNMSAFCRDSDADPSARLVVRLATNLRRKGARIAVCDSPAPAPIRDEREAASASIMVELAPQSVHCRVQPSEVSEVPGEGARTF